VKLSRFAQLTIELIQEYARPVPSTGPGLLQRERDIANAERVLRDETALHDVAVELTPPRWAHSNDPTPRPAHYTVHPMIPVTLTCGHSRLARAHVPIGHYIRCDACNATARIMQKFGTTVREELKPRRPWCPDEFQALQDLRNRVETARFVYTHHYPERDVPPVLQAVFNALDKVPK
jgi:hypothetical protein